MREITQISWHEKKNTISFNCTIDIVVTKGTTNIIFLTIPGIDGTVNGYKGKYSTIAKEVNRRYGATTIQMSNPYISSFHWEDNLRHVLEYVHLNIQELCGHNEDELDLRIFAHSAGGAIATQIAWEYPAISKLLIVNPATKLGPEKIKSGLLAYQGNTTIMVGTEDPSFTEISTLVNSVNKPTVKQITVQGADHYFSEEAFSIFIEASKKYLFEN